MKTFKLSISTPIGKNFEIENATLIDASLTEGRIGVMANHIPLVSALKVSEFIIKTDDKKELVGVLDGGIFSVTNEGVIILTPRFDFSTEVDVEETKNEIEQIKYILQDDVKKIEESSLGDRMYYSETKLKIAK